MTNPPTPAPRRAEAYFRLRVAADAAAESPVAVSDPMVRTGAALLSLAADVVADLILAERDADVVEGARATLNAFAIALTARVRVTTEQTAARAAFVAEMRAAAAPVLADLDRPADMLRAAAVLLDQVAGVVVEGAALEGLLPRRFRTLADQLTAAWAWQLANAPANFPVGTQVRLNPEVARTPAEAAAVGTVAEQRTSTDGTVTWIYVTWPTPARALPHHAVDLVRVVAIGATS